MFRFAIKTLHQVTSKLGFTVGLPMYYFVSAVYFCFFVILTSPSQPAYAQDQGSSRNIVGYGLGSVSKVEGLTQYENDEALLLGGQYGGSNFSSEISLSLVQAQRGVEGDVVGQGITPLELYFTTVRLGIRKGFSIDSIEPWIGLGISGGYLTVSNPSSRSNNDFRILWSHETNWVHGYYGHAGIDIRFADTLGIRFAYLYDSSKTVGYKELGNNIVFTRSEVSLSLLYDIK